MTLCRSSVWCSSSAASPSPQAKAGDKVESCSSSITGDGALYEESDALEDLEHLEDIPKEGECFLLWEDDKLTATQTDVLHLYGDFQRPHETNMASPNTNDIRSDHLWLDPSTSHLEKNILTKEITRQDDQDALMTKHQSSRADERKRELEKPYIRDRTVWMALTVWSRIWVRRLKWLAWVSKPPLACLRAGLGSLPCWTRVVSLSLWNEVEDLSLSAREEGFNQQARVMGQTEVLGWSEWAKLSWSVWDGEYS